MGGKTVPDGAAWFLGTVVSMDFSLGASSSRINASKWNDEATLRMPLPRAWFSAAYERGADRVYLIGGQAGFLRSTECFDPKTNQWTQNDADSLPDQRSGHAYVATKGAQIRIRACTRKHLNCDSDRVYLLSGEPPNVTNWVLTPGNSSNPGSWMSIADTVPARGRSSAVWLGGENPRASLQLITKAYVRRGAPGWRQSSPRHHSSAERDLRHVDRRSSPAECPQLPSPQCLRCGPRRSSCKHAFFSALHAHVLKYDCRTESVRFGRG
jgi:hypothetical protein